MFYLSDTQCDVLYDEKKNIENKFNSFE